MRFTYGVSTYGSRLPKLWILECKLLFRDLSTCHNIRRPTTIPTYVCLSVVIDQDSPKWNWNIILSYWTTKVLKITINIFKLKFTLSGNENFFVKYKHYFQTAWCFHAALVLSLILYSLSIYCHGLLSLHWNSKS